MKTVWSFDQKDISWDALSELYKIAPLGDKSPKDIESSQKALQRIHEIINQPYLLFDATVQITSSIGMATYPNDGNQKETLLNVADKNMYLNKIKI